MAGPPPSVTIPSATRYLAQVRRFVGEQAEAAGLSHRAVDEVQLAVDEACANAIEHAYGGREDGEVVVRAKSEPGRFRVVICHTGVPFDPNRYRPTDLGEAAQYRRKGGFGVMLMNRLVDRIEYRKRGRKNEVHLVKLLNGEDRAQQD